MKTEIARDGKNAEAQRTQNRAEKTVSTQRRKDAKAQSGITLAIASLRLCVFALILLPLCLRAATNDLTSALQKGLFEEEANHNLDAAVAAYQIVSAQFDKDRKLAATAIFRLGEVYRKQGKTNEATAQYERIVREFSDQPTLVALSRQNLDTTRPKEKSAATKPAAEGGNEATQKFLVEAEREVIEAEELSKRIKSLNPEQARIFVQQALSNPIMDSLMRQLAESEQRLATQKKDFDVHHPEIQRTLAVLETIHKQIDAQMESALKTLDLKRAVAERRAGDLRALVGKPTLSPTAVEPTLTTDDEEKEIRRIQQMIQNSPDLINASGDGGYTPLCRAASAGWLRVATYLLDAGAAVNRVSQNSTAMHLAAAGGHKAMIELLAKRGADLNAHDGTGATPLHLAAEQGFLSIAEALVELKADLGSRNSKMNGEQTPLHRAVEKGHPAMVAFLISKGAAIEATNSTGSTPLMIAAGAGHTEILRKLLASGAKPDARSTFGSTALSSAAAKGNGEIVQALLTAKANPDLIDNEGRTALGRAVQSGHAEVAKALLVAKANPNAGTKDSPLLSAVRADNIELADLLLRAGADPNQETDCELLGFTSSLPSPSVPYPGMARPVPTGRRAMLSTGQRGKRTPLQIAVLEERAAMVKLLLQFKGDAKANSPDGFSLVLSTLGNTEILKALLDAGADADANDGKGRYALIMAVSAGNSAAVDLLLAHNAKTEVRGESDQTPLLLAMASGCTNCVASMLAAGADVNVRNINEWSALHYATGHGRKAILQMLLEKGANPNVRNNEGKTPLDLTKPQPGVAVAMPPPGAEPRAKPEELAELLRKHGALDDLPAFDRIQIIRPAANLAKTIFRKSKIAESSFTLLDVIGVQYQFLADNSGGASRKREDARLLFINDFRADSFSFPELTKVRLRRPTPDGKKWEDTLIDLAALLREGDCRQDVALQWGDVIVIPETDHGLGERWDGFNRASLKTFNQCLTRTVEIVVKGQTTKLSIGPKFDFLESNSSPYVTTGAALWIRPVLYGSNLLLASSDLSRVKVTRANASGGKQQEWLLDCSGENAPDFWLRDGDVIEVPDKL